MIAPYAYTRLYRKEHHTDDTDASRMEIDDYFDKYDAIMDLAEIVDVAQGYADPTRICAITFRSGTTIMAFIPFKVMLIRMQDLQRAVIAQELFVRSQ